MSEAGGTLLEQRYRAGASRWTARAIARAKAALAEELLKQSSIDDVVSRLTSRNGPVLASRWDALRLVRTEYVHRYNERAQRGMESAQADMDDLMKRLITPMDSRTAFDSLQIAALPGNIVRPVNEAFEDPVRGKPFLYPPNRPNDRSRIVFWRERWGDGWKKDQQNAAAQLATRRPQLTIDRARQAIRRAANNKISKSKWQDYLPNEPTRPVHLSGVESVSAPYAISIADIRASLAVLKQHGIGEVIAKKPISKITFSGSTLDGCPGHFNKITKEIRIKHPFRVILEEKPIGVAASYMAMAPNQAEAQRRCIIHEAAHHINDAFPALNPIISDAWKSSVRLPV